MSKWADREAQEGLSRVWARNARDYLNAAVGASNPVEAIHHNRRFGRALALAFACDRKAQEIAP